MPGIWPDTAAEGDLVPWTVSADPQRPQWAKAYSPVGQALKATNGPVLAWIGGPGQDHCDATHDAWDGTFVAGDVLLIGRQALSQSKALDMDLAQAMQQGLRAVLFAQDVDFWESRMRWRTSWHVSREFVRTGGAEPRKSPGPACS